MTRVCLVEIKAKRGRRPLLRDHLDEHESGIFEEAFDFAEEFRGDGPVDHPVIATDPQVHPLARDDFAIPDHWFFDDATHAENGRLRRIDDGVK